MCPRKATGKKVYAECNIVINPAMDVKPRRKRFGKVNMKILTSQGAGPAKPITLVLKGKNFARVMELMTLYHKPDEEIAEMARGSILADDVEDMSVKETAVWVRGNIMQELKDIQEAQ